MFKIIRTMYRPSPEVKFWHETVKLPEEYLINLRENYIKTGKRISHTESYSKDRNVFMSISVWSSRDAFLEFMCDMYFYRLSHAPSKVHIVEHDIRVEMDYEEYDE